MKMFKLKLFFLLHYYPAVVNCQGLKQTRYWILTKNSKFYQLSTQVNNKYTKTKFFWGLYHWIDPAALPRSRSYFEICATGNSLLNAILLIGLFMLYLSDLLFHYHFRFHYNKSYTLIITDTLVSRIFLPQV